MPFLRDKTKHVLGKKGRMAVLEYGLFAVLITAVVVVTLTGMGTDFSALYEDLKTRISLPSSGGQPALPVTTPAINNAAAVSG